ncbi:MAG: hypothetical protein RL154_65 [Pseudomonadota bacterium]|jgi:hypothetical protein
MKELSFQVKFLSDIVLPATSNTQGKIEQLDFIAGSNFLGMVAKNYNNFSDSFDIFHSGKVRFGDGHILKDGKITYKMPLSIFKEKNDESIVKNQITESLDCLIQAKQLRNGYITQDKEQVFIDYVYSQKSAYDKTKRRSKDSQMYGYSAIKKGLTWQFVVKIDTISPEDEKLIIKTLETSTRLGKSKSAEYGQVAIKFIGSEVLTSQNCETKVSLPNGEVVLYCNSRLALVDKCGNPTYELKYLCDGLTEANISYDKTQIRTSAFTPYNTARQTKDYERVCINKGSVIVLKNISKEQLEELKNGVGAYLSEGFGDIIINPNFLLEANFTFVPKPKDELKQDERQQITKTFEDKTVQFLVNRHNTAINMLNIANEVAVFVKEHKNGKLKNIKPSQWGNIRSIASSNQDGFIENIKTYIYNGTKKWEDKQIKILMNAIDNHKIDKQKFIKLLAMKMGGQND